MNTICQLLFEAPAKMLENWSNAGLSGTNLSRGQDHKITKFLKTIGKTLLSGLLPWLLITDEVHVTQVKKLEDGHIHY